MNDDDKRAVQSDVANDPIYAKVDPALLDPSMCPAQGNRPRALVLVDTKKKSAAIGVGKDI